MALTRAQRKKEEERKEAASKNKEIAENRHVGFSESLNTLQYATHQGPTVQKARIESFLEEFDLEVENRCVEMKSTCENLVLALKNKVQVELMKLAKKVRTMPVAEFIEKYDGAVENVIHEDIQKVVDWASTIGKAQATKVKYIDVETSPKATKKKGKTRGTKRKSEVPLTRESTDFVSLDSVKDDFQNQPVATATKAKGRGRRKVQKEVAVPPSATRRSTRLQKKHGQEDDAFEELDPYKTPALSKTSKKTAMSTVGRSVRKQKMYEPVFSSQGSPIQPLLPATAKKFKGSRAAISVPISTSQTIDLHDVTDCETLNSKQRETAKKQLEQLANQVMSLMESL